MLSVTEFDDPLRVANRNWNAKRSIWTGETERERERERETDRQTDRQTEKLKQG